MDVEVDLYSGRPNPRFELAPDRAVELSRRLSALPPLLDRSAPAEALGYRGLRVEGGPGDPFVEVTVNRGIVVVRGSGGVEQWLQDSGRALERWLLESGVAELHADDLAALRSQIDD
jgi:hypothetical protein